MNKFVGMGRLTKDIELRHTQSGKAVAQFSLAIDGPKVNGEKTTDFLDFTAWDKTAEILASYKKKGDQLLVEGRLKKRSYEGQDGKKVWVTDIIVSNIEFVGGSGNAAPKKQATNEFGEYDPNEEIPF